MEQKGLSYENARRMRERNIEVTKALCDVASTQSMLTGQLLKDEMKLTTSKLNKAVFDLAESHGRTVYDICMNFMPVYSEPVFKHADGVVSFEQEMRLVPIPMELEKGPGYWECKYQRLVERLQELIGNNEE